MGQVLVLPWKPRQFSAMVTKRHVWAVLGRGGEQHQRSGLLVVLEGVR